MDVKTQEYLKKILAKDINDLNENDISFLIARREYLDNYQMNRLKDAMKVEKPKMPSSEPEAVKEAQSSYNELQKQAKKLGMKNVVGTSRVKLEEFIDKELSKS